MKRPFKMSRPLARRSQENSDQLLLDWSVTTTAAVETVPPAEEDSAPPPQIKPGPVPPKYSLRETVERFLRERGLPYINVDEAKRALFAGAKLRSFHFVVYRPAGKNWLVFAAALRRESRKDLRQWEGIFGDGFAAVVVKRASDGTLRFRTLAGESVELAVTNP
jgi:hypothetical protein